MIHETQNTLSITFGAFAPPLKEQIKKQRPGIRIAADKYAKLQRLADALTLVSIHLLNDTCKRAARMKLLRAITAVVDEASGNA